MGTLSNILVTILAVFQIINFKGTKIWHEREVTRAEK